MLLAGPISHTSTQYMSNFSIFHWICLLFILLILVGVKLPLCIVVTLSENAVYGSYPHKLAFLNCRFSCKIVLINTNQK